MQPRMIAIDPGKTTGVAVWSGDVHADQDEDWLRCCHRLEAWLAAWSGPTVVVIERFIINVNTVGNSQAPWSLELIGVARYLAHKYGADYVLQTPADAKNFMKDERLKKLGWHRKGKVHANDALRHLGLYVFSHKLMSTDVL